MKKRIFAIGDVHGCYDEMMSLYKKLKTEANFKPKRDTIIFIGDYIDRGPKSREVVEQIIKWSKKYPHWEFLTGNHEDMMKNALVYPNQPSWNHWYLQGGRETLASYPNRAIKAEHIDFLNKLPFWTETKDYYFVHAGLVPEVLPENTAERDLLWIRYDFIDSQYDWGKKVIFGHTPDDHTGKFEPIVMENKIGIDTAVCSVLGNGKLTAVELPEEKFYFQPWIKTDSGNHIIK